MPERDRQCCDPVHFKGNNINLKEDYSILSLYVALIVCLLPPERPLS